MKRSRPLSLFLSVLILISCFTISVSAESTENLIDSDLRNWEQVEGTGTTVGYNSHGDCYSIFTLTDYSSSTDLNIKASYLYDLTSLTAGKSYTLKFHLLSLEEVSKFASASFNEIYGGMVNFGGVFVIGLASYNSSSSSYVWVEDCIVSINKDNYLDYFGNDTTITFELPNIVNPCISITYMEASESNYTQKTYIKNVALIDNEQSEEDGFFDRLFQFFHDLKWEIVGGGCGDSDCNKTPHTSLADKIINKVEELKQSFTDLGDTIGSFFDEQFDKIAEFFGGFGNLILYFNWEGEYTNPFEREDSPIDKVSEFFDDLIDYIDSIGTSIENVLDSITGGLHIFDKFTSRFPWLKGIAMFCLAIIVLSRFIGL